MNTVSASTTIEFLEIIKSNKFGNMFRGQADSTWGLTPSIGRYSKKTKNFTSMIALEYMLLDKFRNFALPFSDFRKISDGEQLVHAQHYGLPTRLLDWSTNPLKALFFAVEDHELNEKDGAVFSIYPYQYNNGSSLELDHTDFEAFIPELLHERVAAQDACLVSCPLSDKGMDIPELTPENAKGIISISLKIIIPAKAKIDLRKELSILGITHRTVYPGLEGTTRWIKSDLSAYEM